MSDIAPAAPAAAAPAAPAAPPAAAAAPPAPAPAAPAPEATDAWETTDPADFSTWPEPAKEYVKKLRGEAQTRREALDALKPVQDVFSTLHPQDRDWFAGFLGALQTRDQEQIAPYASGMRELLDQLTPAQAKAVASVAEQAAGDPTFDPYDADALDKRMDSRLEERLKAERDERDKADAARDLERQTNEWKDKLSTKARELAESSGIADFGDPTTTVGGLLYVTANNTFRSESDPMKRLELAAAKIEEDLRTQAQSLLKAKAADAAPSPAPADAAGPSGAKKPGDLKDARASASARLDKIFGGDGVGT